MLEIFREEKVITICMLSFFALSVLMQILLGVLYRKMTWEVENMATTNHRLLKQCKLKFANCYQLNNGVPNIPVFVDKFLCRLAFGPVSFEGIYRLAGQVMLLSIASAGAGICKSILKGRLLVEILPFYIVSFLALYLYFAVSSLMDVRGKRRNLKISLVDYLENHLASRMGATEEDLEMLYGRTRQKPKRSLEFTPISSRAALPVETGDGMSAPGQTRIAMERELEELLQELL